MLIYIPPATHSQTPFHTVTHASWMSSVHALRLVPTMLIDCTDNTALNWAWFSDWFPFHSTKWLGVYCIVWFVVWVVFGLPWWGKDSKQLPANHWLDSKVCLYGVTPWKTASVWSHFWSKRYRVQLYIPQIYMYQWWPLLKAGVTVSAVFAPGLPTLLALSGSQCQWAEG